jgi:pimeloyl-ACP methyl ester carboxylesterase
VLCLHARHDRLLPGHCQQHLTRQLQLPPQAVRWMDGPHLLLQARPQAAAGELVSFLHALA